MDMSRFLMGRIAAVSAAMFLGAFVFAMWRAQFDVEHEGRGAAEVVRAFELLSALQEDDIDTLDGHLAALREIAGSGRMRHLQLRVADVAGREVVSPAPAEPLSLVERAFVAMLPTEPGEGQATTWVIRRDEGVRFVATFMLNPVSEQDEAFEDTASLLVMLFGYGVLTLAAIYWALRRALAPLQPIHVAIGHYQRADYAWRVPSLSMRELDAVGQSLNHMAGALDEAQNVRRTLSLKLLTLQEDERTRIARELHDEFGQVLTAMRADAAWLAQQVGERPDVQAVVRGFADHCRRVHEDVRDLLRELRPQDPRVEGEAVPLRRLLEDLARSWNERPGEGARVELHLDAALDTFDDDFALALYRMTQEALTNAMRHAAATRVDVRIAVEADGTVAWSVEDDGVGLDSATRAMHRGNGLAGISERAWAHQGEIAIDVARDDGGRPGLRLVARFARPGGVAG